MKVNFSRKELSIVLEALERQKRYYDVLAYDSSTPKSVREASRTGLQDVQSIESKLRPEKEENSKEEGDYLYIYVPDGIRDQELGDKLESKIPKNADPDVDNVFWSTKFSNFVVKKEHAEKAERAIEERYGDVKLNKNPGWASKEPTWQIEEVSEESEGKNPSEN